MLYHVISLYHVMSYTIIVHIMCYTNSFHIFPKRFHIVFSPGGWRLEDSHGGLGDLPGSQPGAPVPRPAGESPGAAAAVQGLGKQLQVDGSHTEPGPFLHMFIFLFEKWHKDA